MVEQSAELSSQIAANSVQHYAAPAQSTSFRKFFDRLMLTFALLLLVLQRASDLTKVFGERG